MSKLETAMDTIVEVFKYYSSKEGDKFELSRQELKNLMQGEMGDYMKSSWDHGRVEQMMTDLDDNRDGSVSFEEFVFMVIEVTVRSANFFQGYTPKCYQQKPEVFFCGVR